MPPCPAVSSATTLKPIATSRLSDWAYSSPSQAKPCVTTSGTPRPATSAWTECPSDSWIRCFDSRTVGTLRNVAGRGRARPAGVGAGSRAAEVTYVISALPARPL